MFGNDDEAIMRQIMSRGEGVDMNVDDDLAALEAEVNKEGGNNKKDDDLDISDDEEEKKPAPKQKKDALDDELNALENEGLDDLDDEEEKPKIKKKVEPKVQPKEQAQPKPSINTPKINKQELSKAMQAKQAKSNSSPKSTLYPDIVEKKYHNVEKMNSLGVFEKEKEICSQIIEYKKNHKEDYETWEFKMQSIDDKSSMVLSYIQDGLWDFEMYKKKIKEELIYETKLLQFCAKDPNLNEAQKAKLKERIENRRKIIEEEMKRNPEEEEEAAEEEEKKDIPPQNKETTKPEIEKKTVSTDNGVDFFPEKAEKLYHNINKMDSLGTLENEKKVCDKIIEYRKKRNEDYDSLELKKDSIDTRMQIITTNIENGLMDFEGYKKKIKGQYLYEAKLLQFVEKDTNLNETQKKILIQRVNKRKSIIEEEIKKNPEAEEEEEEENGEKEVTKEEAKPIKEEPKIIKEEPKVKKEELVTKKSINPMNFVSKEREAEEVKRLTQVVNDRLNEYRVAMDYFKKNDLQEQFKEAYASLNKIYVELRKIQEGKWKEVNEFKLPEPVTPEYIYGYSKEERIAKYKKVIKELQNQKKTIQNDINVRLEALKKLTKPQLKKVGPAAKLDLDKLKSRKEKYEKIIKLLLENYQDKWVPAPLYLESEEEIKKEKINADIEENSVKIMFGKTNYSKNDRIYLIVKYPEREDLQVKFNQKKPGDWTYEFTWKLNKDFKNLFRARIEVEIFEKKTILKDKYKGKIIMIPKGLKDHIEYKDDFNIDLESQREGQSAEVTFKVRRACREPEYITEYRPLFQVTKIYPSFNIRGGTTQTAIKLDVERQKVTADDLKVNNPAYHNVPAKTPTPAVKPQKINTPGAASKPKQGGAPAKKPGPPKAPIDRSEFKDEELKDPDCIDCLNTLQVLQFKQNKYEEIRNKIEGRTPRELMQKIIKIKCKYQNLEDSLGDDIGPQDYLALLKVTFAHDKKLLEYFTQIKDQEKAKLVAERLPIILKETEELVKQIPK